MIKRIIWLVIIAAILVFTVPKFLEQFSIFIENMQGDDEIESGEEALIIPPILDSLPSATNSAELLVSGYAEQADRVEIFVNNISKKDVRVKGSDQSFSTKVPLFQGDNDITVQSYDENDNRSAVSQAMSVRYIASGPDLIIDSPVDEDGFETRDQDIQVRGLTDPEATITVNGRWVRVDDDGAFVHEYRLSEGENTIEIVATGPAGNESRSTRRVRYTK